MNVDPAKIREIAAFLRREGTPVVMYAPARERAIARGAVALVERIESRRRAMVAYADYLDSVVSETVTE